VRTVNRDLRISPDLARLSAEAAIVVADRLTAAAAATGAATLVLSGGSTPRALYAVLASEYRDRIPWHAMHVYWGDERYVPATDPASNYRMARECLLDQVPCPAANVHAMPTHLASPADAAAEYESTLKARFAGARPEFDVLLLGVGADGHTASLFPGSPALDERDRWVLAVDAPAESPRRLTLTLPALLHAKTICVLAAGADKAEPLHLALDTPIDPHRWPVSALRRAEGPVIWFCDRNAAARLDP
jgi:6-phosphogluconolactonase